jgi:hydrogenase nickel incorporation protein HypA/HybF
MTRMHELSLLENVIALVEDQWRIAPFSRVLVIRLHLGALGPAEPDCLRFCFDAIAQGTIAEGAKLDIVVIPAQARCPACRRITPLNDRFDACPICANPERHIIVGNELRLAELEVE